MLIKMHLAANNTFKMAAMTSGCACRPPAAR